MNSNVGSPSQSLVLLYTGLQCVGPRIQAYQSGAAHAAHANSLQTLHNALFHAFIIVVSVIVRRRTMIANTVALMRSRKIVMRMVGMLLQSREFVVYMLPFTIHDFFVTVEVVWMFVFMFALLLRNGHG